MPGLQWLDETPRDLNVRPPVYNSNMRSDVEQAEERVRSALESIPDNPLHATEEDLDHGIAALQRIVQAAEAKKLRWVGEVQRRASFRKDGYLSATDWLSDRLNLTRGAAKEQLKTAQVLEALPEARQALEQGRVSPSAVRVLTAAWESHPEAFETSGRQLLKAATTKPVGDLRRTADEWRHRHGESGGLDEAERKRELRGIDLAPSASGMVGVRGDLDPEGGEYVLTAVQAIVDSGIKQGHVDLRTPRQRRADALVELARRYLDSKDRPVVGAERPHITMSVDLEVLKGLRDGTAEFEHGTTVPAETARRISCDASVRRIVLGPRSEPLDVGRATPVVPAAIRRAVIARDKTCRFPNCPRPSAWCQVHHVRHWAQGGETSVSNGVLVCAPHHHLVHEQRFSVGMRDGVPVFRRPDGSVIEDNRAPP